MSIEVFNQMRRLLWAGKDNPVLVYLDLIFFLWMNGQPLMYVIRINLSKMYLFMTEMSCKSHSFHRKGVAKQDTKFIPLMPSQFLVHVLK